MGWWKLKIIQFFVFSCLWYEGLELFARWSVVVISWVYHLHSYCIRSYCPNPAETHLILLNGNENIFLLSRHIDKDIMKYHLLDSDWGFEDVEKCCETSQYPWSYMLNWNIGLSMKNYFGKEPVMFAENVAVWHYWYNPLCKSLCRSGMGSSPAPAWFGLQHLTPASQPKKSPKSNPTTATKPQNKTKKTPLQPNKKNPKLPSKIQTNQPNKNSPTNKK